MFCNAEYPSPIGTLTLVCDGEGEALVGLWLEGQKYFMASLPELPRRGEDKPVLLQAKEWLDRYFAGERPEISELRLTPLGGAFRQGVWEILKAIPYGEVTTYGEVGRKLAGERGLACVSARAVGGAVGHNPISILIPCHRVVGADGGLTGYAGGLEKKIWLLKHEGVDITRLCMPNGGG